MAEKEMEETIDRDAVMGGDESFGDKMPRRYQRRRPRQVVPDYVDWKDVDFLRQFIPERGKIMPRRISGITAKDQRRIAQAIKRARSMAMLPYVSE
jgi:small subunit ribosomal protein S18